jgi:membrane protein
VTLVVDEPTPDLQRIRINGSAAVYEVQTLTITSGLLATTPTGTLSLSYNGTATASAFSANASAATVQSLTQHVHDEIIALILTIDRKLNDIWRVRRPRGVTQRVLVYWAVLTLGPLVLALSLTLTAYAVGDQRALIKGLSVGTRVWLEALEWVLVVGGIAALYRYVPNTPVRWTHALLGGLFVALGLDAAKALLGWYFASIPTYSVVYGAFAAVPILLIWVYVAWVIVLLGAVIAAYLPSLLSGIARRGDTPGWDFQLALEVLGQLQSVQHGPDKGLTSEALSQRLQVSPLQLEEALATLTRLDWVAPIKEDEERHVLLIDPSQTPVRPLVDALLLLPHASMQAFARGSAWDTLTVKQSLTTRSTTPAA